jgi:hypothetical protein
MPTAIENVTVRPDWSGSTPMPITVTPPEPLEPYFHMVQLESPTYFETVFAESLKRLAEARASEQVAAWLEEIIADPEGRKLVQDILDRKAEVIRSAQLHERGEALNVLVNETLSNVTLHSVSIDSDGLGSIILGGEED